MAKIRQLPSHVVSQIAAGEVIERPSSVVKELIENSLDAGATRIDIEMEAGGVELIRITDDGHGIEAEDLPLAFAPHATSKLVEAEDLFHIATMGFRGEALASVGGVAQVLLQSRPPAEASGHEIRCDGGIFTDVRPCGIPVGTRIEVKHLFYNIPGRKKFLKTLATEHSHVCETVTKLAIANPHVHFTLRHNGKTTYEIPATTDLADRIGFFFGSQVRDALLPLDSGDGAYQLRGFITDPKCDRGNAKLQYFYVNGRWFRDRSLSFALQDGYRGLLMTGRYPIGFLFLTVPSDQLDVNVHPAKAEVRFRDSSIVFSMIRTLVKNRLQTEHLIPELEVPSYTIEDRRTRQEDEPAPRPSLFSAEKDDDADEPSLEYRFPSMPQRTPLAVPAREPVMERESPSPQQSPFQPISRPKAEPLPFPERVPVEEPRVESRPAPEPIADPPPTPPPAPKINAVAEPLGPVVQMHDAYLVMETSQGMLVIDQHALHERILYEQLRQRLRNGRLEVQRLLIPEPIELPADQATLVLETAEALAELGLEVTEFGERTILLSSYPVLLSRRPPHEILQGVIDYLVTKETPPTREHLFNDLLATMACKAAVKAGDRLTQEEIQHLLMLRQMAEDSHHCPHGRPTSLIFTRQELDRQFRRI